MATNGLEQLGRNLNEFRTAPTGPVQDVLNAFTALSISKMKKNLVDSGRSATGTLKASIAPLPLEVDEDGNLIVEIEMEDYWDFINQGVNGMGKDWGSPYAFRATPSSPSGSNAWPESIKDWIAAKGIQSLTWTDKHTGETVTKFLKTDADFESAAFIIIKGLKKNGIEPSKFVDDWLTEGRINELAEGIGEAIEEQITKGL